MGNSQGASELSKSDDFGCFFPLCHFLLWRKRLCLRRLELEVLGWLISWEVVPVKHLSGRQCVVGFKQCWALDWIEKCVWIQWWNTSQYSGSVSITFLVKRKQYDQYRSSGHDLTSLCMQIKRIKTPQLIVTTSALSLLYTHVCFSLGDLVPMSHTWAPTPLILRVERAQLGPPTSQAARDWDREVALQATSFTLAHLP